MVKRVSLAKTISKQDLPPIQTIRNGAGLGLIALGLGVFWPAVLIGIRHYLPSGLLVGVIDTSALVVATYGFFLFRVQVDGPRKAAIDALSLFLGFNLIAFEAQLYFNPYPNYWWTRQASDWIAMLGLGTIITNEVVFVVAVVVVFTRILILSLRE